MKDIYFPYSWRQVCAEVLCLFLAKRTAAKYGTTFLAPQLSYLYQDLPADRCDGFAHQEVFSESCVVKLSSRSWFEIADGQSSTQGLRAALALSCVNSDVTFARI
eukprot:3283147-Pleurochrysis_carterae.AAC.2